MKTNKKAKEILVKVTNQEHRSAQTRKLEHKIIELFPIPLLNKTLTRLKYNNYRLQWKELHLNLYLRHPKENQKTTRETKRRPREKNEAPGTYRCSKHSTFSPREAEAIKKMWPELYKKELHDPDNHESVITHTHLEPDILEREVMWAFGSITTNKASEGDGIPVELLQILKSDTVGMLHSICRQTWKTQQWPQDWKRSVFIPIPKKGNAKEGSNYHSIALISHASKVMLKILQARLQQYVNRELSDVQAGFRKGRGNRDQIANICWVIEKAGEIQKSIYFCFF